MIRKLIRWILLFDVYGELKNFQSGFMKSRICALFLIINLLLMLGCKSQNDGSTETDGQRPNQMVDLVFTIQDRAGSPLSPSILNVYPAETGITGEPLATFQSDHDEILHGWIEKGMPVVIEIIPAWHESLSMFIPSTSTDQIKIEVIPSPLIRKENLSPAIIGEFNLFDPFSKVDMELQDDGTWTGIIEYDQPTLKYQVSGFASNHYTHGSQGDLKADTVRSEIVSVITNEQSNEFLISFEPEKYDFGNRRAEIRFNEDVPLVIRGISKLSAIMYEQSKLIENIRNDQQLTGELFREYLSELEHIKNEFDHRDVEFAYRIAKARFNDFFQKDSRWIDQLLNDMDSNSELWLIHPQLVHKLFTNSSRMEPVSRNIWNIYQRQASEAIQTEALYSLLNFHYDRGEDEEWHEAHYELVRSFPESIRINYSYKKGFAPESVVHIDMYFPDLSYTPLYSDTGPIIPSSMNNSLTILYFWSFNDSNLDKQFEILEELYQSYNEVGLQIISISLDRDSNRDQLKRYHQYRNHNWITGFESITNPQIQVLGITDTPHTIFLENTNRVIYHGTSILEDEQLHDYVEDYYHKLF
jgi:thiol-disulfide isomerase/thioredoxin